MKVRDIKQYRQRIIAKTNDNIEQFKLGAEDEPILVRLYAEEPDIKSIIEDISSFADNTFEQIFYEFLQNADDAGIDGGGASRMTILFEENSLVVINNGEPFLTDGEKTKGQLRSFLRSKDSKKRNEAGVIGKYGLGSKLLYDLIPSVTNYEERTQDQLRKKALIKDLNGVYLFSWSNLHQIETFTQGVRSQDIQFEGLPEDNKLPLLTKILYSYYPAYINETKVVLDGENKNLFSEIEFDGFRKSVEKVFSIDNKLNFEKGTAIFIPIGEGVSEQLQQKLSTVLEYRIGIALNFLRNVKQVNINGKLITKIQGDKIPIEFNAITFDDDDNEIEKRFKAAILLPNQVDIANTNFYQFLPIIKEKRNLGFIIHTENLKLLQNRQNIKEDENHNQRMFEKIFNQIEKKLESHFDADEAFYNKFIFNFIQSGEPDLPIIKKYFYDDIIEKLKQSLPIVGNQYATAENIKIKSTQLNINPSDIGLDFHWLDVSFKYNYNNFKVKFGLEEWNIASLFDTADTEKVRVWIKNLSEVDYKILLSEIKVAPNFPFIKTSKDKVLTIFEVQNDENVIPLTSKTKDLKDIFYVNEIEYTDVSLLEFENLLPKIEVIDRLKTEIEKVRAYLNENQKHIIFKTFKTNFTEKEKDLAIFKNRQGVFYRLGQLVKNDIAIAPSGILHDFQIDPIEPYFNEYDGYFLKENDVWIFIYLFWADRIKPKLKIEKYKAVIDNLNRFFDNRLIKHEYENGVRKEVFGQLLPTIDWVLTTDNTLTTPSAAFLYKNLAKLNHAEYDLICNFITQNTGWKKVSKTVFDTIKDVDFCNWTDKSLKNIHDSLEQNQYEISTELIQVFLKIDERLLSHFVITEQNGQLYLEKKNGRTQFYSIDSELFMFLEQNNYINLPSQVRYLFNEENGLKIENETFTLELVIKFKAEKALINLVSNQSKKVKEQFIHYLQRIDLFSNTLNYTQQSYESKIIEMIVGSENRENHKSKIFIDNQCLTDVQYNDRVMVKYDERNLQFKASVLVDYQAIDLGVIKSKFRFSTSDLFDAEDYPLDEIEIDEIINAEQVVFLFVTDNWSFELNENDNIFNTEILNRLFYHRLKGIKEVFSKITTWILVDEQKQKLLLDEEVLPFWVRNWIVNDNEKLSWIDKNGLRKDNCSTIKIRENYQTKQKWDEKNIETEIKNKSKAKRTLTWLATQKEIEFHKYFTDNYIKFVETYIIKHKSFPEQLLVKNNSIGEWCIVKSEITDTNNTIYAKGLNEEQFKIYHAELFQNGIEYILNIGEKPQNEVVAKINEDYYELLLSEYNNIDHISKKQWDTKFYQKWQAEFLKNFIFLTQDDIPSLLSLQYGETTIEVTDTTASSNCKLIGQKLNSNREIILKTDKKDEPKFILKVLEEHLESVFQGEQDKFVRLQSLFIEELTETKNQGKGDGNINIPEATAEQKKKIEENADKIKNNLDAIEKGHFFPPHGRNGDGDFTQEDKDDEIPNRAKISGRIGELAIYFWLKKHRRFDVEDDAKDMRPYDLLLNRNDKQFHLEVKTKAGSFNEDGGSIPIFLRQTQKEWIQANKIQHYFLTTISLKDVGLYDFYKRFRDKDLEIHENENEIRIALENEMSDYNYKAITENEFHMRLTSPNSQDDPFL